MNNMFYEVTAKLQLESQKRPLKEIYLTEAEGVHEAELNVINDLASSGIDYEITCVKQSSIKKIIEKI